MRSVRSSHLTGKGPRTLIAHWLGTHPGMFIRLDVPGESGLIDWLQHLGLEGVDRVVTMVRGTRANA